VLKSKIKFLSFLEKYYSKDRLYAILPIVFITTILIVSLVNTIRETKELSESNQPIKNIERDLIISPTEDGTKRETNFSNLVYYNSYLNINYIESLFKNWARLFDLFSSNAKFHQKIKTINKKDLERINERVNKVQDEFKIGNVHELVDEFGDLIVTECNYYKLDWRLVLAIIRQESFFNAFAKSRAGAFGFMQIMPRTGSGLQNQLRLEDTRTPKNNLIAGIYYYATLIAYFDFVGEDKYKFALAAYNAGLGRVIDAMTITYYFDLDYNKWENVKDAYPYLASSEDSIHALVWPSSKRPPYGTLNNWKEPYNYVRSIMFYYSEYKKMFESNLKDENKKKRNEEKIIDY
jgi:membrane-bound lytic murein transglycosylase MltF